MFSLQHLSSFLTAVRSRVACDALGSLAATVQSLANPVREAVEEARSASESARQASADVMSARGEASAAIAASRTDESVLLEEVGHMQAGYIYQQSRVGEEMNDPAAVRQTAHDGRREGDFSS